MSGTPQGARWVGVLVALDAIAGAALVLAGVYLIAPNLADFGLYLEAERYRLAGGVLIYAGLVLGYAAVFGLMTPRAGFVREFAGAVFGTPGRFWVAAVSLVLASRAAIAEWPIASVVLVAVPGLLAAVSLRLAFIARARAATTPVVKPIGPRTGRRAPFALTPYLVRGIGLVITVCASILVMVCAFYAYVLLDAAFIGGRQIDVGYVFEGASGNVLPPMLVLTGVMLSLVVSSGVALKVASLLRRPAYDRDLSADEVSFASACVQRIKDYVAEHDLAPLAHWWSRVSLWMFGGAGVVALALIYGAERLIGALYAPPGLDWYVYVVAEPGVAVVAAVAALSLAVVPRAIAQLVSRRAAEASGAGFVGALGDAGALERAVVAGVRDRTLAPVSFDPGDMMRSAGRYLALFALGWNALVFAGLAWWWPHDRARDTLYSEGGIETGDFWSMERAVYPYASVEAVRLRCQAFGNGGVEIAYEIALPGGPRRELVRERTLRVDIDSLVRVDEKLRAAHVRVLFSIPDELPVFDTEIVDRACVIKLTEGMDDAAREKVEQLFHLDEWFERRWRLRTGTLYTAAQ